MTKSPQIKVKSRRQHIRIWFEYYKLCLDDSDLKANLKKSEDFYRLWGDVRNIRFDDWWKTHSYLFGETRVEEISRVYKNPNIVNVSIPINQPITQSIKTIRELVKDRQNERLKELGIDPQRIKSPSKSLRNRFDLTPGVEIRGKTEYEILLIYQIWISEGRPPINSEFCKEVVDRLSSRPRSKWVPYQLSVPPERNKKGKVEYTDSQIRSIRRYIKKGQQVSRRCLSTKMSRPLIMQL